MSYKPKQLVLLQEDGIWGWTGRLFTLTFVEAGGQSSLVIWKKGEQIQITGIRCGLRAADVVATALEAVEDVVVPPDTSGSSDQTLYH